MDCDTFDVKKKSLIALVYFFCLKCVAFGAGQVGVRNSLQLSLGNQETQNR